MKKTISYLIIFSLPILLIGCDSQTKSKNNIISTSDLSISNELPFHQIDSFNLYYHTLTEHPTPENLKALRTFLQKSIPVNTIEYFTYEPDSTFLPKVATSEDGNLKIYSYDNALGGTMRYYDKIWLYDSNRNLDEIKVIYDEDSNEAKGMVYDIKSINLNNKTHYLVFGQNIYSSQGIRNYVEAYQIINDELAPSKLFSTPSKTTHTLYVDYNFNSVIDREERPVQLIKLINDTVSIAIIDDLGNVTDEVEYYIRQKNDSLFKYIK